MQDLRLFKFSHLMLAEATAFQHLFPGVPFISGRRTIRGQATAMAINTVRRRTYCGEVYPHSLFLQQAVDLHPEVTGLIALTDLLAEALMHCTVEELAHFSHLNGDAGDLDHGDLENAQGVCTPMGTEVKAYIRSRPATKYFTTREAGLARWHWACRHEVIDGAGG